MKILWHSNGPNSPTGYGNQTALFTERIHQVDDFEVAISAFYGVQATPLMLPSGIICLPPVKDLYGDDVIQAHMDFVKGDMVFTLVDPFMFDPNIWGKLPWAAWTPVDSEPDKPGNIALLKHARWVIAMSRFGERVLRDAGLNPLYVPHGVDTKAFIPINRDEARARLAETWEVDLTGKHLLVTNMANKGKPSRKNFDALLQAYQGWLSKHPDSVLYIHTEKTGMWNGEHLPTMIAALGIPADKVIFPHQYRYLMGMWGVDYLNDVYNAGDVYVHPSQGEGFGIPIVEAQAAGCPVIVTDFSAMSELCFAGEKVPGIPVMYVEGTFQRKISVPGMLQALGKILMSDSQHYQKLREQARAGALEYDVENVMKKYMLPVLRKIKGELFPRKTVADRREIRRLKRNGVKPEVDEEMPDVSVLFPAYNLIENYPSGLAEKAILSALNQPGIKVQVVAVDDTSTDESYDLLRKLRDRYTGITVLRHAANKGSSESANTAAKAARGRYLVIQSARSWWEQGALSTLCKTLDERPEIGFAYGCTEYWGERQGLNVPPVFRSEDFNTGFPSSFGYMYRREAFDKGCQYTPYMKVDGKTLCIGDRDFMLQLIHNLKWEGLALPELKALNYLYSLSKGNQMTNLLIEHRQAMTQKLRERFPMVEGTA